MAQPSTRGAGNELGKLLRYWRDLRSKTQITLALDAGV